MLEYSWSSLSSVSPDDLQIFDHAYLTEQRPRLDTDLTQRVLAAASGASTAKEVVTILGIPSSSTLAKIRHSDSGKFAQIFRTLFFCDAPFALTFLSNLSRTGQLSSVDATAWLFPYLAERNSKILDLVYFTLLEIGDPTTLAELALKSYREGKSERFITLSTSILSDLKSRSLDAFDYLVENTSGREIEYYFVSLLCLSEVSLERKKAWLEKLARNPSYKVKEHILENLGIISDRNTSLSTLLILSTDSDTKIKSSAEEALKSVKY